MRKPQKFNHKGCGYTKSVIISLLIPIWRLDSPENNRTIKPAPNQNV